LYWAVQNRRLYLDKKRVLVPFVGAVAVINITMMIVYMISDGPEETGDVNRRYQLYPVFGTFVAGFLWSLVLWGLEAPSPLNPRIPSAAGTLEAESQSSVLANSLHVPVAGNDEIADQHDAARAAASASSTPSAATDPDWGRDESPAEQESDVMGFNPDDCNWFQRRIGYTVVVEYGPADEQGHIRKVRYYPVR
jgi:hypothetical protein